MSLKLLLCLLFQEPNLLVRPPRNTSSPEIVIHIALVYKLLYKIGKKMQKSDKLGIHGLLEQKILLCLELAISASYAPTENKLVYLEKLRTLVEVCKHMLRTESELGIIPEKSYIFISGKLVEISKQITGWIKYIETKNRTN